MNFNSGHFRDITWIPYYQTKDTHLLSLRKSFFFFFPFCLILEPGLFSAFQLLLIYIHTYVIGIFQNIYYKYYVLVSR